MDAASNTLNGYWKISDYIGSFRARLGIRRNQYKVEPGLYSLGNPDKESPVLVTANYKLTLDHLRRAVKDFKVWILVLDTKGINVWCAAGKGTFGTEELINQIRKTELSLKVSTTQLILPQLGAPGMIPSEVKKSTGFSIIYGPVEAVDLPEFIKNGNKATDQMRKKQFTIKERFAVSMTHFAQGLLPSLGIATLFIVLDLIFFYKTGNNLKSSILSNSLIVLISIATGSIVASVLLPLLPGRSFSLKGLSIGIIFSALSFIYLINIFPWQSYLYGGGKILLLLIWIVFQVLNLTGSSTYTSLSGVQKEMAISIPILAAGSLAGLVLIITGGLI